MAVKKAIEATIDRLRARAFKHDDELVRRALVDRARTLQQFFFEHGYADGFLSIDTHLT